MKTKSIKQDKINVITLGCSKNLVDSENLITQLQANDYEVDHEAPGRDANIVIINTCGFIDRAKEESIDTILQYSELRSDGELDKLYVTGCLSQRYKDQLALEIPEVDAWFGTMDMPALLARLNADYKHELIGERLLSTPAHFAYMKISEGCNRTCAFCAIPLMRGKHRSRSIEELVREARHFASIGVKELILIAQELTYYGLDIYKKRALGQLLQALAEVDGIEWIRLHYAYPSKFPLDILDVIREEDKVCNYLDIPLQHASDPVLSRMRRQITRAETEELIQEIRDRVPDITLRTTMLVGFPGETDQDMDSLKEFIQTHRFDRLGVFTYSHEENTRAHELEDDVPEEVKQRRANELMEIQRDISWEKNQQWVGKKVRVLFDRKEGDFFVGRTEADSPEVDNEVLVSARDYFVRIGDFADILIESAEEFDLFGKPVT